MHLQPWMLAVIGSYIGYDGPFGRSSWRCKSMLRDDPWDIINDVTGGSTPIDFGDVIIGSSGTLPGELLMSDTAVQIRGGVLIASSSSVVMLVNIVLPCAVRFSIPSLEWDPSESLDRLILTDRGRKEPSGMLLVSSRIG